MTRSPSRPFSKQLVDHVTASRLPTTAIIERHDQHRKPTIPRGRPSLNLLDQLALRAAVLKLLSDQVNAAFKAAKDDMARELGPEGRKNAVLDGTKIASVSVTKSGRMSVSSEALFTRWVEEHYPTEIEQVSRVRPAFFEAIKKASEEAGEPCSPRGDLDIPGLTIGDPFPLVRKTPGAEELVEKLWQSGRLTLNGEIKEIEQ